LRENPSAVYSKLTGSTWHETKPLTWTLQQWITEIKTHGKHEGLNTQD